MATIEFSKAQTSEMVDKLQRYFSAELDQDLAQFDAEFLLDFIAKELGGHFYNRGIEDSRLILQNRLETIDDDLYAIEKDLS
ncbi:DUF2164 domain-containing protein [Thalassotalea sp. PLHSN55]|uniref:DUF2164 domain-containing protein n=1 Tax=Thalassotalea sp. PLHSN55 TaxID=3435888 RepID=UPI003F850FD8